MAKTRAEELKEKITQLEGMGEHDAAEKYKAELAQIENKGGTKTMPEEEGLVASATQEDYEKETGDWVTIDQKIGFVDLKVEVQTPSWKTPGVSYLIPVVVTQEGIDNGKNAELYPGASTGAIWKLKQIYRAVTGEDMPFVKGKDGQPHPNLIPSKLAGKEAVGHWVLVTGHKGGDPNAEIVKYPKLESILPAGSVTSELGI